MCSIALRMIKAMVLSTVKKAIDMARKPGDTNYSVREEVLLAKIKQKDAALKAEKAKGAVKDATIRELRLKLGRR